MASRPRQPRRLHTTEQAPHVEGAPADDDDPDYEEHPKHPLRRCIVTREQDDRAAMLRFVLDPDRVVVPDLSARLPGRGYWLSPRVFMLEAGLQEAGRKKGLASAFARAARGPVSLPPDLAGLVQAGLTRRVTEHIGLGRRAGQAVAGFARAREWVAAGRAGLVVQASDGSEDECRRLMSGAGEVPVAWPLDGLALGAVFGRDHVVHVAVAPGRIAESVLTEIGRLAGVTGKTLSRLTVTKTTVPRIDVIKTGG